VFERTVLSVGAVSGEWLGPGVEVEVDVSGQREAAAVAMTALTLVARAL
jgi:hypothetical protein